MSTQPDSEETEIVEHSTTGTTLVLEAQERASIDIQINTAKRFPRVLSTVKKKMLEFATLDQETASGCFYTLPARKGGDGKAIMGPSARLAEIAVSCYGHIRAAARIVSNDGKFITAQGVCHDLENNVSVSVEVKRRITNKQGHTFSEDMQVVTGNAACSIAFRNAVFKVVPMALVKPVYEGAKKVAIGDAKTLGARRADAMAHFAKMGVNKEKVLASLNLKSVEDITLEHLEHLIGLANAIKEGDTSIEDAFKPASEVPAPAAGISAALAAPKNEANDRVPGDPVAPAEQSRQGGSVTSGSHKPAEAGSTPAPAPTPDAAAPGTLAVDREMVIDLIKNGILDSNGATTEAKLLRWATNAANSKRGLVPEGIDDLFALPTTSLVAIYEGYFGKKVGAK